jgi:hypothetical protein
LHIFFRSCLFNIINIHLISYETRWRYSSVFNFRKLIGWIKWIIFSASWCELNTLRRWALNITVV